MTAKVEKTLETSKFSIKNGKLCCNGKTYAESNYDEKQSFNDFLKDEDDDKLLAMLERTTMPLSTIDVKMLKKLFVTPITSTGLYKSVPHFV
ncbi:hypothetical protein CAPN010_16390 [Capnocytophaga cynodegmi]|uniref:hypothetical protein n=1 Tax=Capnocytophaga cynodegmi TaxID=28189 RepID=UPI001EE1A033|nr:hypothetical protein [Capnocytophaga cynodegmi]GJQ07481.1 hypothetical protein CAPN010_16390 [Capnocytophaga cynodegmi]